MSPTNSMRTGSASPAGKMSTMPPRMAKEPCSSTGSSRVKPASTSRSARSCGSISVPDRISSEALQQALRRADARQQRRRRGDDQTRRAGRGAVQRAGARGRHAEMRRHAAVGIDLQRRQRQHGAFDVRVRRALERRHRRSARRPSSARRPCRSARRAASRRSAARAATAAASAFAAGVRPARTRAGRSSDAGSGAAEQRAKREGCRRGHCVYMRSARRARGEVGIAIPLSHAGPLFRKPTSPC